jgi:hypothetical protein
MVNRDEMKGVDAVPVLEQQLKTRCERAKESPLTENSLEEQFRAALVYQTLSPAEGGKALSEAKTQLETPILEGAKQMDWLLVLHY